MERTVTLDRLTLFNLAFIAFELITDGWLPQQVAVVMIVAVNLTGFVLMWRGDQSQR
jgi:hypothetical protein